LHQLPTHLQLALLFLIPLLLQMITLILPSILQLHVKIPFHYIAR
jgi:hypothetical protein